MKNWGALREELDAWLAAGKQLDFWWRDDDVCEDTPALQRLLGLAAEHRVPLMLAAIPAALQPSLVNALATAPPWVFLCQHGYAHQNHAPPEAKKRELCARPFDGSDVSAAAQDLVMGDDALTAAFEGADTLRRLPVLVPPWNRIDSQLVRRLPQLGFKGLSTFGPNPAPRDDGFIEINCHLDIFQWKPERRFLGEEDLLRRFTEDLRQRRSTDPATEGAYGLLTHHLVQDESCWLFLERFFTLLSQHSALRLPLPSDLFATSRPNSAVTADDHGVREAVP